MRGFYCLALKNEEKIRKRWGKKYGTLGKIFTPAVSASMKICCLTTPKNSSVLGTFMYYAEEDYPNERGFESIPQSLWWSVQTITSVGNNNNNYQIISP